MTKMDITRFAMKLFTCRLHTGIRILIYIHYEGINNSIVLYVKEK